jgi:hypothetical protein
MLVAAPPIAGLGMAVGAAFFWCWWLDQQSE